MKITSYGVCRPGLGRRAATLLALMVALVGSVLSPNSPAQAADPGWYGPYEIMVLAGGSSLYCLDAEASHIQNGGPIQLYTCNGWANQQWYLDGSRLRNAANTDFCLDAEASHIVSGGPIQLFACGSGNNQRWSTVRTDSWALLRNNANTSLCLDAEASHIQNGGPIQLFTCLGGNNQLWRAF